MSSGHKAGMSSGIDYGVVTVIVLWVVVTILLLLWAGHFQGRLPLDHGFASKWDSWVIAGSRARIAREFSILSKPFTRVSKVDPSCPFTNEMVSRC